VGNFAPRYLASDRVLSIWIRFAAYLLMATRLCIFPAGT